MPDERYDARFVEVLPFQRKQSTPAYQVVPGEAKVKVSQSGLGFVETLFLVGSTGFLGYSVGKEHGRNEGRKEGYNQAKAEDSIAIQQLHRDLQQANGALSSMRQEREQQLQEMQRLRSENEVLKALVAERPASAQTEAILKALQRVELRLTEILPPEFDAGNNGQNPGLN